MTARKFPRTVLEAVERGYRALEAAEKAAWRGDDQDLIHVSEVKSCFRFVVMNRMDVPITNPRPVQDKMVMDVGKAFHGKLDKWASAGTIVIRADLEDSPFHVADDLLTGHPDDLMLLERGMVCVDWKTVRIGAIMRHIKAGKPSDDDVLQITMYLGLLGLRYGVIVYVDRDSGKQVEFLVEYNETLYAQGRVEARQLLGLIRRAEATGELPPVPEGLKHDSYPCWYRTKDNPDGFFCEMWDHCWGGTRLQKVAPKQQPNQPMAKGAVTSTPKSAVASSPLDDTVPAPGVLTA